MRFATWNIQSKTKISLEVAVELMQLANIDVLVLLECHTPMKTAMEEWRGERLQAQQRQAQGGSGRPRRGSMSIRSDANLLRYHLAFRVLGNGDKDRMAVISDTSKATPNDIVKVTVPGMTRPIVHVDVDDLASGFQWDFACCHAEYTTVDPLQYVTNAVKWSEENAMDVLMGDCNLYGPVNDINKFKNVLAEPTSKGNSPLDRIYVITGRGFDQCGRIISNGGTNTNNPLVPVNQGKVVDLVVNLGVVLQDAYIQPDHIPIYIDC